MKILITGGAGYIGSVTVRQLDQQGHDIVVLDNMKYGHREAVSAYQVIEEDLTDQVFLNASLSGIEFDAVIHFAAYALAGESMENPYKYFQNNIAGGLNLLEYMKDAGIKHIIFSSTCAIYGTPQKLPVSETEKKTPESVYGESKLMFETILNWYEKVYGIKHINLRYFNAAGAALDGSIGEDHNPETHIIPLAIQTALGRNPYFSLFGTDYPTKDGTCMRDYIHVEDLAQAHILALNKLKNEAVSDSFNLGTGMGYSNSEVLEEVKKVSGVEFEIRKEDRRIGDPPMIFADNSKAQKILKFVPKYSDLETIVKTAWNWHEKKSKEKSEKSK